MLPKKKRADTKIVERIFKTGKSLHFPNLTFKFILTNESAVPSISFIAPKNISKQAADRNMLRRRGYTALGKYIQLFPAGTLGAFMFKKNQDNVLILENEIKEVLNKIN